MFEFKLPDIGEGISEAEIVEWKVSVGDRVNEGDELVAVSTDKVDVELPSPRPGVIEALQGQPGDVVRVGTVLVRIDDGAAPARADRPGSEPGATAAAKASRGNGPSGAVGMAAPRAASQRVIASPSTRKFAAEHRIDLTTVRGSGVHGRILRRDVEGLVSVPVRDAPPPVAGVRRERLAGARATAAERLAHSAHTLATSTLTFEAAGDGLQDLLVKLAPEAERRTVRLTPLALIAKCVAAALRLHPRLNATIDEETRELVMYDRVDLGIAVAGESGLVVPVVIGVDRMPVLEVARSLDDIATRGRSGRLAIAEMRGGTFTLSSTGGLERARMLSATPVVNLPHVATMWVSRIVDRPRVADGRLEAGPMITSSLSFDHRFIDGAEATTFINDAVEFLECPERALA